MPHRKMSPGSEQTEPRARRTTLVILLSVGIFLSFFLVLSQASFNLTFMHPNASPLAFAALSALIFLLLVALTFVLLRNLLKLFAERRGGVLGSKFRTKMVVGALALSFAPVIFLFLFAYGLMNRSIDKWFSAPVEEVRQDTEAVSRLLSSYAAQNARAEARSIAAAPATREAFATGNFNGVVSVFREHEPTLQGGFTVALRRGDAEAAFHAPAAWPVMKSSVALLRAQRDTPARFTWQGTEYMLGSARVGSDGWILVGVPLPAEFAAIARQIEASQQHYLELAQERKLVRRTYMGILLLLTVLLLFAATWFALLLSKLVTRPVEALARATGEISRGRLDYRVQVHAADELGELVESFNRMAAEMESSRKQTIAAARELEDANTQLEQRRRHMETILESIPTGVLSIDADRRITHVNAALRRIFNPKGRDGAAPRFHLGAHLADVLPGETMETIDSMLPKADRMGTVVSQMESSLEGAALNLAVTASALQHAGQRLGYVIVFEDLSDLLKGQKQAAWREVARRVAHEIKNPLTPMALSAERICRHLDKSTPPDRASSAIIRSCAETIAAAVETVRKLVDEFSTLARFPTAHPKPADVNAIVENTLALFNGRLNSVQVRTSFAANLPHVMADAEALKRALANLVDNAAEATQQSLLREVQISTALAPGREAVEIVVADTGPGVTSELKQKLFLPYFSTKRRGTGLGLAIVSRIVEDHHGSIRVEENEPVGARFVIELPLAAEIVSSSTA
jgi:two-component system nitrogen regulation sensor histidine kinase NtrY